MPDSESLAIITQIQQHFAANGWQPLLQVKVNGLKTLSCQRLRELLPKVLQASERLAAVTAILEAVIPQPEASSMESPDLSDSATLRLRQ